jgi:hypothetical protein
MGARLPTTISNRPIGNPRLAPLGIEPQRFWLILLPIITADIGLACMLAHEATIAQVGFFCTNSFIHTERI